jgi:CheY-like chemotaxis protein
VVAEDGVQGLRLARERRPDVVLLDIEMPGMNGFDVCSLMKTDPALSTVPVIVMTGRPVAGVPAQVQAVGAVALLTKPFERDVLMKTVTAHLPRAGRGLEE